MLRLRTYALAMILAVPTLVACGGDDGGHKGDDSDPDASVNPACDLAEPASELVFNGGDESGIAWSQPLTLTVDGADQVFVSFEFYAGIEDSLTGSIDLSAGNQSSYATCAACVLIAAVDADGNLVKAFFQDGGTLDLTADPIATGTLAGTANDVSLIEVTISDDDFSTTPVDGGVCLSLGTLELDANSVPVAWTCPDEKYGDGATCDCECGVHDPDCDDSEATVAGCTGDQICGGDDTCIDTCNVLSEPPETCSSGVCGFYTATQDICYTDATRVDPATLGAACESTTAVFCAVSDTVATGVCDNFESDDLQCRQACDEAGDCASAEETCAPIIGAKGVCITPPENETCQSAEELTLGTPVTATTGGATGDYDAGLEGDTCDGFPQPGGDVVYKVTLTEQQTITVALSDVSAHFDPSVAIVGPGDPAVCDAEPITLCGAGADAGLGGEDETFTYTATAEGTYYIIVDSFSPTQGGTFTLTATEQ